MTRLIIFALPCSEGLAETLSMALHADQGVLECRQFPDGETYLRVMIDVADRNVILMC